MKISNPAIVIIGTCLLVLSGCTTQPAKEAGAPKSETSAGEAAKTCDQCGTIEAIVQKVVSASPGGYAGAAGYFVYDLYIRMDKTGFLKIVTVGTEGNYVEGQRVKIFGGSVDPLI